MNDIQCPNCGKAFKIDESGYVDILRQVRDHTFEQQIQERLALAETDKTNAVELAKAQTSEALKFQAAEKEKQLQDQAAERDRQIAELRSRLDRISLEQELSVNKAVGLVEKQRDELTYRLQLTEQEKQISEQNLKQQYEIRIKDRDAEIERLKEFKARLSTKMVGETLEQHCSVEFERIRATAFPNAYFERDTDARTGSMGDFVFLDRDQVGTEVISIMFEMKNEADTTATKKKNEDFLKELDKDRN